MFPALAAAASRMELFGCSKREIEQRFTKSEIAIMAWRSQEQASAMNKRMNGNGKTSSSKKRRQSGVPAGLPDHFFDERGDLNLSKVTGVEAYKFFSSQGMKLPIINRRR